jgi:hypothetical protein
LTFILAAAGVNTVPSMDAIYVLFGTLVMSDLKTRLVMETVSGSNFSFPVQLLLNCGFFVFLLHIMYTVFLTKLGIKPSLRPPRWLEKAILM